MYAQDYDETFLSGRYPGVCIFGHTHADAAPNAINDYYGWQNHLQPYIKNTQIFRCPSATWTTCTSGAGSAVIRNAYLYNYDGCVGKGMGQIQVPAEQMMHMDGQNAFVISSTNAKATCMSGMGNGLRRHNEGANIVYVDGHAKWLAGTAIDSLIPAIAGSWSEFLGIYMQ